MQNIETMLELIQSCSQTNKVGERFNRNSFALNIKHSLELFCSQLFCCRLFSLLLIFYLRGWLKVASPWKIFIWNSTKFAFLKIHFVFYKNLLILFAPKLIFYWNVEHPKIISRIWYAQRLAIISLERSKAWPGTQITIQFQFRIWSTITFVDDIIGVTAFCRCGQHLIKFDRKNQFNSKIQRQHSRQDAQKWILQDPNSISAFQYSTRQILRNGDALALFHVGLICVISKAASLSPRTIKLWITASNSQMLSHFNSTTRHCQELSRCRYN